ncbi:P-loop containing nucleoside triphosphate hydrolase protein [Scenedesmus sp. NREL 46B-D3]|nr:P-loop containing nucleoside triphosphate hydrolase protein [Scenedesmus sp. NREL 46B-D3]
MQKGRGSRVMKRKTAGRVGYTLPPSGSSLSTSTGTPAGAPQAAATHTPAAAAAAASSVAALVPSVGADLQRQIEEALPPRGSFKELHGAAGTPQDQRRESPIVEMSLLLAEAVMHGLRTIAFCKSRKLCELISAYTRENLKACAPHKAGLVKVYRAGYSPAERRQLEADLHSGALTAVAATNALELGIDVGSLDLTLHMGFPGSVASLWQQAGRAGRRSQPSLSLYVAFDGPLDQHFMMHPQELFQRPIECVQLDPCNAIVLHSHLVCAAKELPLLPSDDGCEALHYVGRAPNPAADISLRTIDPERFVIYNAADACVLEEIEANMAFYEIYDGAIYMYQVGGDRAGLSFFLQRGPAGGL